MSQEREINVTDMVKVAELNLYWRLRKAGSELTETTINEEVENCLRNCKSFSIIVLCNVLLKTVNGKQKSIEDFKGKIQSLLTHFSPGSHFYTPRKRRFSDVFWAYRNVTLDQSAVRRLEFKFKIFMETKSDEETARTESSNRPGVELPKSEIKRFSADPLEQETLKETFETATEHNRNLTKIENLFICVVISK